jgi:hypothetical protein|tara:strand:- start:1410 stop:1736 length:327 start_codon:yes stop_codon:yes gene_type:complete
MHDDQPTLIMVKRSIAGPDIITPGMGYQQARKQMLHAEGLDAGGPCGPAPKSTPASAPAGHEDDMKQIAEELYKASEMHKGQADRLMSYVQDDSHDDSDSHGDKKDLG